MDGRGQSQRQGEQRGVELICTGVSAVGGEKQT